MPEGAWIKLVESFPTVGKSTICYAIVMLDSTHNCLHTAVEIDQGQAAVIEKTFRKSGTQAIILQFQHREASVYVITYLWFED
jgi:hypothetical protein